MPAKIIGILENAEECQGMQMNAQDNVFYGYYEVCVYVMFTEL